MKADQERVKNLLTETVTLLCKNGLTYNEELRIEGLIGITVDSKDVFLVHVNECFKESASSNTLSTRPVLTMPPLTPASHKSPRIPCPIQSSKKAQSSPTLHSTPLKRTFSASADTSETYSEKNIEQNESLTDSLHIKDENNASIDEDDDDDDDVVIITDTGGRIDGKSEDQTFGDVDFSTLQDNQEYSDSLVDTGQNGPPSKRLNTNNDYLAVKNEPNSANQWEHLSSTALQSLPGCSDWPGDRSLNDSQMMENDAVGTF